MADNIKNFAVNSARWLSLEDFEGEVWKNIPDYEGWYQVSNMGRIKSLDRQFSLQRVCDHIPRVLSLKGQIIKASLGYGKYLICHLKRNGTSKAVKYHRIVCTAFHENIENLPEVNHINEVKTDNRADNLEWCTRKYNINWGTALERAAAKTRNHPNTSKPVYQFTKDCVLVKRYPSIKQASRETGIKEVNISSVCKDGKSSSAGGFIWSHTDNIAEIKKKANRKNINSAKYAEKPVIMLDKNGHFIREFKSLTEAHLITGIQKDTIARCCRHYGYYKTAGGYKWEFK